MPGIVNGEEEKAKLAEIIYQNRLDRDEYERRVSQPITWNEQGLAVPVDMTKKATDKVSQ